MTEPAHMNDDALAQVDAWRLVQDALRTRDQYRTHFVVTGLTCLTMVWLVIRSVLHHWGAGYFAGYSMLALLMLCLAASHLRGVRQAEALLRARRAELTRLEEGP